ncbi:hypothetical protein K523DRAFT_403012, partial [Schizophyllum commune Tattone D]
WRAVLLCSSAAPGRSGNVQRVYAFHSVTSPISPRCASHRRRGMCGGCVPGLPVIWGLATLTTGPFLALPSSALPRPSVPGDSAVYNLSRSDDDTCLGRLSTAPCFSPNFRFSANADALFFVLPLVRPKEPIHRVIEAPFCVPGEGGEQWSGASW